MNLTKKILIGLPAFTQSGQHLGRVSDFEFDPVHHLIVRYHLKAGDIIKDLLQSELIVSREQVVSITAQKMTVEDAILAETEAQKEVLKKPVPAS